MERCQYVVPFIVVRARVERSERVSVKQLLALNQPLEVVLHLLELVPGREQVLVHNLGEPRLDGLHRSLAKSFAL